MRRAAAFWQAKLLFNYANGGPQGAEMIAGGLHPA